MSGWQLLLSCGQNNSTYIDNLVNKALIVLSIVIVGMLPKKL